MNHQKMNSGPLSADRQSCQRPPSLPDTLLAGSAFIGDLGIMIERNALGCPRFESAARTLTPRVPVPRKFIGRTKEGLLHASPALLVLPALRARRSASAWDLTERSRYKRYLKTWRCIATTPRHGMKNAILSKHSVPRFSRAPTTDLPRKEGGLLVK